MQKGFLFRVCRAVALSCTAAVVVSCAPSGLPASPEKPAPSSTSVDAAPGSIAPSETQSPSPSSSASSAPPPSPTPSPSPSPSPSPTSKSAVAGSGNAVNAQVVQTWMKGTAAPANKTVFLTFDDGPNDTVTPRVLDILKEYDVNATFFVVGKEVSKAPDVLRRTVAEGNTVALHSYDHNYKKLYPGRRGNADEIVKQYEDSLAAVRSVLGDDYTTSTWRYPGGHMSWKNLAPADEALAAQGVYWIDWNAMTGDAEPANRRPTSVSAMVSLATAPISVGTKAVVMLAHDTGDKSLTVKSLPQIIEAYRDAGYDFAVMS